MILVPLVLWTSLLGPGSPGPDAGADQFLEGLKFQADAATARRHFAASAAAYDQDWHAGRQTPEVALMRGRAHFLADQLPEAIAAFRAGLERFPWDAELQAGLTVCRSRVAYPGEFEPAERVRPDPLDTLRHRVSPWDLVVLAGLAALVTIIGLARRLTAGDGWALPVAGLGVAGLIAIATASWLIERDRDEPVVVLAADTVLRTGNGLSYPARLELPLPRGAEVRELGRRGGWVQVEVAGGAAGWLPETVLLK